MFAFAWGKRGKILDAVLGMSDQMLADQALKVADAEALRNEVATLKAERSVRLEELARARRENEHAIELRKEESAKREREIEHMLGLERKRQEFELASGKKEAMLSVREENLVADRKRFEEQMSFHEKRFTEEVKYLKDMIGTLADRLPTAHTERVDLRNG